MNLTRISLDTNVLIFGLRKVDPYAELILQNLFSDCYLENLLRIIVIFSSF